MTREERRVQAEFADIVESVGGTVEFAREQIGYRANAYPAVTVTFDGRVYRKVAPTLKLAINLLMVDVRREARRAERRF